MTTAAGVVFLAKDTGRCLLQLRNSDKRFKNTCNMVVVILIPGVAG